MQARTGNGSIAFPIDFKNDGTRYIYVRLGMLAEANKSKYPALFGSKVFCDLYNKLEKSNVETMLANREGSEATVYIVSNMMNCFLATVAKSKKITNWIDLQNKGVIRYA